MSPADLPLRDIHLPPPPSWWPPAPGWWMLAGALLLGVLAAWWWRRRRPQRDALGEARSLLAGLRVRAGSLDAVALAADLSQLLRRVCVSLWPREQVAGLVGDDWLAFLDRVQGADHFTRGPGRLLVQAPYRREVQRQDVEALFEVCASWLDAMAAARRGDRK